MLLGTVTKQPSEIIDFDVDFSEWLADRDNDTIEDVFATVDVEDLMLVRTDQVGGLVKQWVAAGFDAALYQVTLTVYTQAGRVKEVEVRVRVKEV